MVREHSAERRLVRLNEIESNCELSTKLLLVFRRGLREALAIRQSSVQLTRQVFRWMIQGPAAVTQTNF